MVKTINYHGFHWGGTGNVVINSQLQGGDFSTALTAGGGVKVTVNGNVEDGVTALESAEVTVNGDINGTDGTAPDSDGNLDNGNMDDPGSYSDGNTGVYADDDAKVTVNGNVTGGDAYGTYAYAGTGVSAEGNSTVIVSGDVTGGNVTAKPEVESEGMPSMAGAGVAATSRSNVEVGGNVTGGSTNGKDGEAGQGIVIGLVALEDEEELGQIVVKGNVTGGTATAEGGVNASGISVITFNAPTEVAVEDFYNDDHLTAHVVYDATSNIDWYGYELGLDTDEINAYILAYEEAVEKVYSDTTGGSLQDASDVYQAIYDAILALQGDEQTAFKEALLQCYNDVIADITPEDFYENVPQVEVYSVQGGGDAEAISSDIEEVITKLVKDSLSYTIKVTQGANGTVSVDKATAKTGEKVVVTATPAKGYQVSKVLVNGKEIKAVDGAYSFIVAEGGAIEVTAEFKVATQLPVSPKTGDYSQTVLYMMLAVLSLGTVVVTKKKMVR